MTARAALAVGLLSIAALVGLLWTQQHRVFESRPRESPQTAELAATLAEARRELRSLKQSQLVLAAQKSLSSSPPAAFTPETSGEPGQASEPPEPEASDPAVVAEAEAIALEAERKAVGARYDRLSTEHREEPRDALWAREVEAAYRNQLEALPDDGPEPRPEIIALECKTDLCRMELEFASEKEARASRAARPQHSSIRRTTSRVSVTEDAARVVVYAARGDRSLYPLRRPASE